MATLRVSPLLSVPVTAPVAEVPVSWAVRIIRSPAATPPVRQTVMLPDVWEFVNQFVAIWLMNLAVLPDWGLTVTVLVALEVWLLPSVAVTVTV